MAINPFGIVQQVEQQVEAEAQQPAFQPTLDKETTRRLAEQYKANPKAFNPQTLAQLENHAAYHQVPFYPGEFNLGEAVMQLGKGFASGFTTFEVGEHPDNEYENIARSLGHLLGFAPGMLGAPLKALGAVSLARKVGKVKSVPLFLSGKATEKLGKVLGPTIKAAAKGRSGATATAANWILKNNVGRAATHVAEGAFNLGLASGISAWQGGVDAMMTSAGHGAVFGGVFRTLGNVVNTGDKSADTAIRAIAGSLFQGLPATMRGATSAEQVYDYLLGAYFGAGETSWYKHGANRFMRDMQKEMPNSSELEYTSDPRLMGDRWKNLHEKEQAQVEKQIEEVISPEFQRVRGWTLLKYLGDRGVNVEGKITKEGDITKEGYDFLVKEKKAGLDKAFKESDMEVPEPELTPEGVKVEPAAQRLAAKLKQINIDVAANQKEMRILQDSLAEEMKKKKEGEQDEIKISYAKDKIKELKDNIEKQLLERVKIDESVKGIGTQLEMFVENGNDNDVGLVTTNGNSTVVGHRALQFVEHNLKNVWDVKDFSAEMKADLKTLAANELNTILLKNLNRGKNPDTKVIMKEIKSQFKTAVEPELEGSLRQWMNQLNKGHKQKFLRIKFIPEVFDDESGESIRPAEVKVEEFSTKQPYTAGGARKLVVEPIKLIEEVYIENGGKVGKKEIGSLITIDHLSVKQKDGGLKDKKLSDLRKEDEFNQTNNYEDTISNIQNKLHKKGFYMFGGRGDADKLFFVKFHPLTSPKEMVITKSSAEIRSEFEDWVSNPSYSPRAKKDIIRKDIKDYDESKAMIEFVAWQNKDNPEYKGKPLRIKDGEFVDRKELQKSKPIRGFDSYLDKNVFKTDDYELAEKDFVGRMFHMKDSEAKELHKKIVKSNILYDLGMNGLSVNKKNLKEIWENKDGFLNNALAYNKRLQILFTPSWAGSREYAEQTFGKKGETPDKDFIKAGNRFRYIVIPDLKDLPKGLHSEKLLDFDAQLYKEHVDGAIIGRDDVVDYNNKDAGAPESGQNKAFIVSPESVKEKGKTKELGSLYGKFMFHKAGDKISEAMKKHGIHYIIHESAAKQMGLRNYNNYALKRKSMQLENDNIYHLDPRHIKYNYSVKQGKNMYLHNARIPKQWFGALNSKILVKPIPTDVINDIFNETIYKTYTGEKEWNTKLSEYLEKPTPQKEAELLNNIDKIGVNDLLRVINSSEGTSFADGAYQKLLRINKEIALSNAKEEGTRSEDLNEYIHELDDFNTVTDRLIRESMHIARGKDVMSSAIFAHKWIRPYRIQVMKNYIMSQITKPKIKNSLAARMRPYDLGLQNDWDGYNKNLKLLKKRDDIFFLDNDYRNMPLFTYLKESRGVKARTLGEFWDALQKGTYDGFKKEAEEVLRAMVVRVPMDSISGSHALKFMGFTGRNGHGVLMHPRSMRALGGADLDGDEAFVFFGGKSSTNEGEGMKKSWKDAFEANKDEYVQYVSKNPTSYKWNPKTKKKEPVYDYLTKEEYNVSKEQDKYAAFIPDNKRGMVNRPDGEYAGETFEDLLTNGATPYSKKLAKSKVWMYSPDPRRQISENVVSGRNLLGGVSTMTQTMKAAHDVMSNLKVKEDVFRFEVPNEKSANHGTWEVVIEPRQEKEWLDYARRLSSSMVAFTSDPMDVGGIKSYNKMWKELHDAYFRIKEVRKIETEEKVDKDTGEIKEVEKVEYEMDFLENREFYEEFTPVGENFFVPQEAMTGKLRHGLVKRFAELNSGLFGRDYTSGRNWNEHEVRDKTSFLNKVNDSHLTNMLGKQGKLVTETESWSDNILNKLDVGKLQDLYKEMNTLAKRFKMDMKDDKADWIEDVMGRSSFTIPEDKFVMKVLDNKYKPWQFGSRQDKDTEEWLGRDAMALDDFGANPGKLYRFVKDLPYTFSEYETKWRTKSKKQTTSWKRKQQNMARQEFRQDLKDDKLTNEQRKQVVEEVIKQAEDYVLTNDIHDMVSLKLMTDLVKKNRETLTDDVIKEIHTKVDEIKNNSYLANRERMDVNDFYETNSYADKSVRESWELVEEAQKLAGVKKIESEGSAKMDQMEADRAMREYKKTLSSAAEKRLFDYLMLGSYNRAKKSIKELLQVKDKDGNSLISSIGQIDQATNYWYKFTGARTSMMKLGFSSEAIPSQSIRSFLKEYMKLTGRAMVRNKSELKKTQELAAKLDTKTVKYENEDVPFIEDRTPKKIDKSYVGDMQNYEGLVKGKLPKDQEKIIVELADNLAHLHNTHSMNLNHITQGIIGKPLNEMSKQDYISLNEFFKDIRRGSIWQRLFGEDAPDMKRRYHMLFPKSVNKEMMKYDILWLKKEGWFKMKGKEVFGTISKPSWWLEGIQDWISRMGEKSMDLADALKMEVNTNLSFYVENVNNGETLRRFAVRQMERDLQHNITTEKTSNKSRDQKRILAEEYENRYQEMWKDKNVQDALNKNYSITNPKGERERVSGTEIVERISKVYENMNEKMFEIISGKPGALLKYQRKDKDGILEFFDEDRVEPKLDWKLFVKDISNAYKKGEELPLYFGIDGLRQMGRSMKLDFAWERVNELKEKFEIAKNKKKQDRTEEEENLIDTFSYRMKESENLINKLESSKITKTGQYNFKTYFPHMFHSRSEAKKSLERQLKAIENDGEMPEEVKQEERIKLMHRLNTLTGDWVDSHGEIWENYDKAAEQILGDRVRKGEKIKWTDLDLTSPNMMSRSTHIPGWSIDHTSYEIYAGNIANTYFTQMNQIFTRAMIHQFRSRAIKKGWDKIKFNDKSNLNLMQKWENYLKLYAQEAMGGNSIIPDYIYNDPGMKISGTPYGWWADNRVKKKMQKIKDALVSDKTKYPHLNKLMKEIPYQTLRKISNLEAKFELASLLAHPKSAVGNVFGGSIHTIQSAGYQNWRKGRDIKWLQRINPEWKSKEDINRFIIKHGVVPDFMMNEWGLNPEVVKRGKQDFMKDVVKNMQEGKIDKRTFNDLMHKHKLSKSMMQLAANFMSKPEMMLRRHAFMAHYVQAWERFDGAIDNIDHPFLIEMAKKGVQATQFLYSAPYRPAFARSALGKIMTRFQLWQWNAVRFRNDVAKEARIFGLQEGTPAYEKFVRTLQTDLFVFAMANVFMYSLFETALPAPWNWMQDTADWIFGDEKERERTFMGTWPANIAPLQLVTPPIARLPVAGLDAFIADDWKRFSNYHIYTMFPFGRILKDFSPWASNNLLENPMMVIDKFTGMPMYGAQRMAKRVKEDGVYKP